MAQFDVYANPQPGSAQSVPFVVDMQSGLIDQLPTRLVMPLSRVGAQAGKLPTVLCPVVELLGEKLTAMPHLAAPVAARSLKKPVTSLRHMAPALVACFDAVLSGF